MTTADDYLMLGVANDVLDSDTAPGAGLLGKRTRPGRHHRRRRHARRRPSGSPRSSATCSAPTSRAAAHAPVPPCPAGSTSRLLPAPARRPRCRRRRRRRGRPDRGRPAGRAGADRRALPVGSYDGTRRRRGARLGGDATSARTSFVSRLAGGRPGRPAGVAGGRSGRFRFVGAGHGGRRRTSGTLKPESTRIRGQGHERACRSWHEHPTRIALVVATADSTQAQRGSAGAPRRRPRGPARGAEGSFSSRSGMTATSSASPCRPRPPSHSADRVAGMWCEGGNAGVAQLVTCAARTGARSGRTGRR